MPSYKQFECLRNLKIVLTLGGRSQGWNFSRHATAMKQLFTSIEETSNCDWIQKLALVITENKSLDTLKGWAPWDSLSIEKDITHIINHQRTPSKIISNEEFTSPDVESIPGTPFMKSPTEQKGTSPFPKVYSSKKRKLNYN